MGRVAICTRKMDGCDIESLPSVRGIFTAKDGGSKCQGLWAISDNAHDIPGESHEFELVLEKASDDSNKVFPISGTYRGWFMLLESVGNVKIAEELEIVFNKNEKSSGYSIRGQGDNLFGRFIIKGSMTSSGYAQMYRRYKSFNPPSICAKNDADNNQFSEGMTGDLGKLGRPRSAQVKHEVEASVDIDRGGTTRHAIRSEDTAGTACDLPQSAFSRTTSTPALPTQAISSMNSSGVTGIIPSHLPVTSADTDGIPSARKEKNTKVYSKKKEATGEKKGPIKIVVGDLVKMKPQHDAVLLIGRVVAIDLIDQRNIYIIQDEKSGDIIPDARRNTFSRLLEPSGTSIDASSSKSNKQHKLKTTYSSNPVNVVPKPKKKLMKFTRGIFSLPPPLLCKILSVYLQVKDLSRLDWALCTSDGSRELYFKLLKSDDVVLDQVIISDSNNIKPIMNWLLSRSIKIFKMLVRVSSFTADDAILFRKLQVIEYCMTCDKLHDSSVAFLARNDKIGSLKLSGNNYISAAAFNFIAENMKQVRVLDIGHIRKMNDVIIQRIAVNMVNITTLVISNNKLITDLGLRYIATYLKDLDYLDISGYGNTVSDLGIKEVCENLKHLRALDISKCSAVTDAGIEYLSRLVGLEILAISGCWRCTENKLNKLAMSLVKMRKLDVSYCHISDATLALIGHNMTEINELYVQCCRITDIGVQSILENSKGIKVLNVSDCSQVCVVYHPNVHIIS